MANDFVFQGSIVGLRESAEREISKIRPVELRINDRASLALGKMSSNAKEFDKSLEAAQARTLAFGASVGIIMGVQRAFSDLVRTTIQVEKRLAEINVVLGESAGGLKKFSDRLFDVAKTTGQTFNTVSEAALEFSRQGLNAESTLKRVNDAMILTRLSGLDATSSVEALTAAVNGFVKEGLDTAKIVNRLANVDAKFAVSSRDLAEALSRVGASAQDAGVNFNQLIALVTSAQQLTARGGSVIGNSLKTIFTRIGREGTLSQLEQFGVSIKDASGQAKDAIEIIKSLAATYDSLGKTQQNELSELVGGVYQINILKSIVGDLSREFGIYDSALKVANSSTDEAIKRNEQLNKTIAALANESLQNITQLASKIGELSLGPAIRSLLDGFNQITGALASSLNPEGQGQTFAQGFLKGLGNYMSTSGFLLIGAVLTVLFSKTVSFAFKALKDTIGLSTEIERQQKLRIGINQLLQEATSLERAAYMQATSRAEQEKIINGLIRERIALQNAQRSSGLSASSGSGINRKYNYDDTDGSFGLNRIGIQQQILRRSPPRFASGYMPAMMEEKIAIKQGVGGASPNARPISIPNFAFGAGKRGTAVVNSDEYLVPNYAGGGTAVFNKDMVKKYGMPKGAIRAMAGGSIPIDTSKFSIRQLQAMLRKGMGPLRQKTHMESMGPADPKNLTEDELISVLKKLDMGSTEKEYIKGRSVRQIVQTRLAQGNKALEQAIGSLVFKKFKMLDAIAKDIEIRGQANSAAGYQALKDDLFKQSINAFQTGKRTTKTYYPPQVHGPFLPESEKPTKTPQTAFQKAASAAGGWNASMTGIIGRMHGEVAQRYWQEKTPNSGSGFLRSAEDMIAAKNDSGRFHFEDNDVKERIARKNLAAQEAAKIEAQRVDVIARRRLGISRDNPLNDPDLASRLDNERAYVAQQRQGAAATIQANAPRKRAQELITKQHRNALAKQKWDERAARFAIEEFRKKDSGIMSFMGLGNASKQADEISDRRKLTGPARERLRDAAEQAKFARTNRLQNSMLGTSLALGIGSGFVPKAQNSMALGGMGLQVGSLFGPLGAVIGGLSGATIGAIKDFNNLEKAIGELGGHADKTAADNNILINSLQEYTNAQASLNDAIKSGASQTVVDNLSNTLTNALKGIGNSDIRNKVIDSRGDIEKLQSILTETSIGGGKNVSAASIPALIGQMVAKNQNFLGIKGNISTEEENQISKAISSSFTATEKGLRKVNVVLNSGTKDIQELEDAFKGLGVDTKTIATLFDKQFLGKFPDTLRDILQQVAELEKIEGKIGNVGDSGKRLNSILLDTSKTIDRLSKKLQLGFSLDSIGRQSISESRKISNAGYMEVAGRSLSSSDKLDLDLRFKKEDLFAKLDDQIASATAGFKTALLEQIKNAPRSSGGNIESLLKGNASLEDIIKGINLTNNEELTKNMEDMLGEVSVMRAETEKEVKLLEQQTQYLKIVALEESRKRLSVSPIENNIGSIIASAFKSAKGIDSLSGLTDNGKLGYNARTMLGAYQQAEGAGVILNSAATKEKARLENVAAETLLKDMAAKLIGTAGSEPLVQSITKQIEDLRGQAGDETLERLKKQTEDKNIVSMGKFTDSISKGAERIAASVGDFSSELKTLFDNEKNAKTLNAAKNQESFLQRQASFIAEKQREVDNPRTSYRMLKSSERGFFGSSYYGSKMDLMAQRKSMDAGADSNVTAIYRVAANVAKKALGNNKSPSESFDNDDYGTLKENIQSMHFSDLRKIGFKGQENNDNDIKNFGNQLVKEFLKGYIVEPPEVEEAKKSIEKAKQELLAAYSVSTLTSALDISIGAANKEFSADKKKLGEEAATKRFQERMSEVATRASGTRSQLAAYGNSPHLAALDNYISSAKSAKPQSDFMDFLSLRGNGKGIDTNTIRSRFGADLFPESPQVPAARTEKDFLDFMSGKGQIKPRFGLSSPFGEPKANARSEIANLALSNEEIDKRTFGLHAKYKEIESDKENITRKVNALKQQGLDLNNVELSVLQAQDRELDTKKRALDAQVDSLARQNAEYVKINQNIRKVNRELARDQFEKDVDDVINDPYANNAEYKDALYTNSRNAIIGQHGQTSATTLMGGMMSEFAQTKQDMLNLAEIGAQVGSSVKQSLANSFNDFVTGAMSASEAMKGFAVSVLKAMSQIMTQKAAEMILGLIFNAFMPTPGLSGVQSNVLRTPSASGATMTPFNVTASRMPVGRASGGPITGGSGIADDVLVKAMGGEFVINKRSTQKYLPLIKAINDDNMPGFNAGGMIGSYSAPSSKSIGMPVAARAPISVEINVTIQDGKATETKTSARGGGGDQGKDIGKAIRSVVIDELIQQQRPGGILSR